MRREYLDLLQCPLCMSRLALTGESNDAGDIESGELQCQNVSCKRKYAIRGFVPRFIESNSYSDSFGPQWKTFAKTQLDDEACQESMLRFVSEIDWRADELQGKHVIELGSGAGRFVDVVSRLGANLVIGLDASDAVDASQSNLGGRDNVLFVQGDIFSPPFRREVFDFAYSIGVLHHTPDPPAAFEKMVDLVRAGGRAGVSVYEISLYHRRNRNSLKVSTKELFWALNMWRCEFFRSITTRIPSSWFLAYCRFFIPVLHWINKIPILRYARYLFPATCYRHLPVEWSMLDTHDTYATQIVHQYRHKDVFQWFLRAGLHNIVINNGRAGWVSLTGAKLAIPLIDEMQRAIREQPLGPGLAENTDPEESPSDDRKTAPALVGAHQQHDV